METVLSIMKDMRVTIKNKRIKNIERGSTLFNNKKDRWRFSPVFLKSSDIA